MEKFIELKTKKLLNENELQARFPNILPAKLMSNDQLAKKGYARVTVHSKKPIDPETQTYEDKVLEQYSNGTWHIRTPIRNKTKVEIQYEADLKVDMVKSDIRSFAENRILRGIDLDGSIFKADDLTTQRLLEAAEILEEGIQNKVSFKSSAGVTYSFKDPVVIRNLRKHLLKLRINILDASAKLQDNIPENPFDSSHWPEIPNINTSDLSS